MEINYINIDQVEKTYKNFLINEFLTKNKNFFDNVEINLLANSFDELCIKPLFFAIKIKNSYFPFFYNFDLFLKLFSKENYKNKYFYSITLEYDSEEIFDEKLKEFFKKIFFITFRENFSFFLYVIFILFSTFESFKNYIIFYKSTLLFEYKTQIDNILYNLSNIKNNNLLIDYLFNELSCKNNDNFDNKNNHIDLLKKSYKDLLDTILYLKENLIYFVNLKIKEKELKKLFLILKDKLIFNNLKLIFEISKNLCLNKNYFMSLINFTYEILNQYRNNKDYKTVLLEILNKVDKFKNLSNKLSNNFEIIEFIKLYYEIILYEKKPLNQKQKEFFDFLNLIKNPFYKKNEVELREYLNSISLKKIQFNFSPYFEEKEFEIKYKFKKVEDIIKFSKEVEKLIKNFKNIWEKI
ncbi:MAG: hypothetical protein N3A58_04800 [Spirochaetes bacterium]|nr:hypothetical protein [Spirochaetota bacterium]